MTQLLSEPVLVWAARMAGTIAAVEPPQHRVL